MGSRQQEGRSWLLLGCLRRHQLLTLLLVGPRAFQCWTESNRGCIRKLTGRQSTCASGGTQCRTQRSASSLGPFARGWAELAAFTFCSLQL